MKGFLDNLYKAWNAWSRTTVPSSKSLGAVRSLSLDIAHIHRKALVAPELADRLNLTYVEPVVVREPSDCGALALPRRFAVERQVAKQVFGCQRFEKSSVADVISRQAASTSRRIGVLMGAP
jgi:hypothetical protein